MYLPNNNWVPINSIIMICTVCTELLIHFRFLFSPSKKQQHFEWINKLNECTLTKVSSVDLLKRHQKTHVFKKKQDYTIIIGACIPLHWPFDLVYLRVKLSEWITSTKKDVSCFFKNREPHVKKFTWAALFCTFVFLSASNNCSKPVATIIIIIDAMILTVKVNLHISDLYLLHYNYWYLFRLDYVFLNVHTIKLTSYLEKYGLLKILSICVVDTLWSKTWGLGSLVFVISDKEKFRVS